jgi:hypothetical protein
MRRILASDFGIWPLMLAQERLSENLYRSPMIWGRLATYLLLYDQIIIPTGNFQIIPVLRLMLGEAAFDDVIRNKGIALARYDQWFGYIGGGGGLAFYTAYEDPNKPTRGPNLALSFFQPVEQAIDVVLAVSNPPSTAQRRSEIKNLLLDNLVQLPMDSIVNGLKEESYRDILGSPYLRDFMALRNLGKSLDNLRGAKSNGVVTFNPASKPKDAVPEIQSVLRVAFENFLLSMGSHAAVTEITGDDSTLNILRAKGQRLGYAAEGLNAFAQIQKVTGVPDLGAAFASRQLSARQLLDLRYSTHCQALRDWFAGGSPSDAAEDTLRRYVESVGKPSWIETLPAKALRFATTTGIGVTGTVPGAIASAIDTFMLSRWFPGKGPRLFMERAKIVLDNSPTISKSVMKGRDRNALCSCGSGKKYKKCCGR